MRSLVALLLGSLGSRGASARQGSAREELQSAQLSLLIAEREVALAAARRLIMPRLGLFWLQAECRAPGWGFHLGPEGDGGYVVCLPKPLGPPCTVYSFGLDEAGRHWGFDDAVEARGCKVFGFEPRVSPAYASRLKTPVQWALTSEDRVYSKGAVPFEWPGIDYLAETNQQPWEAVTLASAMRRLGHDHLDVLKVDIEGMEWRALGRLVEDGLLQAGKVQCLVVEWHFDPLADMRLLRRYVEVLKRLRASGMFLVHVVAGGPHCVVASYVFSPPSEWLLTEPRAPRRHHDSPRSPFCDVWEHWLQHHLDGARAAATVEPLTTALRIPDGANGLREGMLGPVVKAAGEILQDGAVHCSPTGGTGVELCRCSAPGGFRVDQTFVFNDGQAMQCVRDSGASLCVRFRGPIASERVVAEPSQSAMPEEPSQSAIEGSLNPVLQESLQALGGREALHTFQRFRSELRNLGEIPKVLHVTWATKFGVLESRSPMILGGIRNFTALNPDWRVELSDDADVERYLQQKLPAQHYARLKHVHIVEKSDLWRLLKIYYEGGVYMDLDRLVNLRMSDVMGPQTKCLLPTFRGFDGTGSLLDLSQDFMCSAPFNGMFERVVELNLERRARCQASIVDATAESCSVTGLGPGTYMDGVTLHIYGRAIHRQPRGETSQHLDYTLDALYPHLSTSKEVPPLLTVTYRRPPTIGLPGSESWERRRQFLLAAKAEWYHAQGVDFHP